LCTALFVSSCLGTLANIISAVIGAKSSLRFDDIKHLVNMGAKHVFQAVQYTENGQVTMTVDN
jgi:hypothetical protein